MKYLMLFVMTLWVSGAVAQQTQCVEVPKGQKIVLIPWFVPEKELVWEWKPAKLPSEKEEDCDRLGVSPDTCEG
jgi:hypothetical protein